jgi:hypothetical protein
MNNHAYVSKDLLIKRASRNNIMYVSGWVGSNLSHNVCVCVCVFVVAQFDKLYHVGELYAISYHDTTQHICVIVVVYICTHQP